MFRPVPAAARIFRTAALLAAWGCGPGRTSPPPDLPAVGSQVSLFRFPRDGGSVRGYRPDSLTPAGWSSLQPVPGTARILGADLDEGVLWGLDAEGNLLSVDLDSRNVRKVVEGVTAGILGPDGSLYLADAQHRIVRVVRRQPVRFHDSLPTVPRALFGTVNEQLIALTGPPFRLITANADQALRSIVVPPGEISATAWGDLVAITADSAVLLYETGGQQTARTIKGASHPRRAGFSPSGHRVYLTQDNAEIRVYDRFTLERLPSIALPGLPREFRVDPSGRWLLAHPAAGDSVWVVDLATNALAASVPAGWAADLPLVAGAATLVVRRGSQIASLDLLGSPPRLLGRLDGGGSDLWLAAAWVPRERLPAAVAAAESATVVQDSALQGSSTLPAPSADSTVLYLQVSRTQNSEWATLLAKQLGTDGYPTTVLPPKEPDDGYRVLVGPYPSRETADSAGRRLGRAYFVLRLPAPHP